jgi:hypothetical protein
MAVVAEVACPRCRRLLAEVAAGSDGELHIRYREIGLAERPESAQGVVQRRDRRATSAPMPQPGKRTVWACYCPDANCPGVFVLDRTWVAQLVERARVEGHAIRWTPAPGDVARSERMRPLTRGSYWMGDGPRVDAGDPGPLVDVRAARVRVPEAPR